MKTAASSLVPPASELPEFCSTKQAADMIGVSHRTIQLWVESGVLQAWKTAGGHRRITSASVLKLVEQRREAIGAPASVAPAAAEPATDKKKLLIVDDDATMLRLYELEMAGWGLPVELLKASNGFEALIKIGESKPDMLISDLNMPGMDGFRMIRTLRSDPAYAEMAIVVISGLDQGTVASMGLPADIPFFSKPASFTRLRSLVEGALQAA
jgi:excisionase family DNA binding protein